MRRKHLKKFLHVVALTCLLCTTFVLPSFALGTDTTSHRPTYNLKPFEGNVAISMSNDYGVNREDVYTLTFDSNSSIPLPSLGDSIPSVTASTNTLTTQQTLQEKTSPKSLHQYLRYIPTDKLTDPSLGGNAYMVNQLTADSDLKQYLASNTNSSTSISFQIDDLYIPYKGNRPNLYFLPSASLKLEGVSDRGFTASRYVYYAFNTYSYDASGNLTSQSYTLIADVALDNNNVLNFPLIPYGHPTPYTGSTPIIKTPNSDFTSYSQGFTALRPTYDSDFPLNKLSAPYGGVVRIGNLNVTVIIPPTQKQYIDDGEVEIELSSVYYTPPNGSATNSKQNALSTAYQRALTKAYSSPTDTNWFGWIVDSVGAFLDIRILGSLTIGTAFGLVFSIPLLVIVLRSFDGG